MDIKRIFHLGSNLGKYLGLSDMVKQGNNEGIFRSMLKPI
jgi:hypothetical protein